MVEMINKTNMKNIKKGDYISPKEDLTCFKSDKKYEIIKHYKDGESIVVMDDAGDSVELLIKHLKEDGFELIRGYPKVMEVSNLPNFPTHRTFKRVVFMRKGGMYLTWYFAQTLKDAEDVVATNSYKYAREVEEDKEEHIQQIDTSNINRVEVIDGKSRSYVNWQNNNNVELSQQDDGKTLKIFIKSK